MLYDAREVAKFIVSYCNAKGMPASNLKLQKLLYYVWIDFYKRSGEALFLNDICAWQLGPVVPDVYYDYCSYGGRPIRIIVDSAPEREDIGTLENILERYINTPASTLVDMTHELGTPWSKTYREGMGNRDVIPFDLIRDIECGR